MCRKSTEDWRQVGCRARCVVEGKPKHGRQYRRASAGGSVHLGVELLNTVATCRATVPHNKGFEDPAFKGYSDRSWSMWRSRILVPFGAKLRLNQHFPGDSAVFLDPESFVAIHKCVDIQKIQSSATPKSKILVHVSRLLCWLRLGSWEEEGCDAKVSM